MGSGSTLGPSLGVLAWENAFWGLFRPEDEVDPLRLVVWKGISDMAAEAVSVCVVCKADDAAEAMHEVCVGVDF